MQTVGSREKVLPCDKPTIELAIQSEPILSMFAAATWDVKKKNETSRRQ